MGPNVTLLDCTLRDGGYYTRWDFSDQLVHLYLEKMALLPVGIIELGYRSLPENEYFGRFYYTPVHVIELARRLLRDDQKIAVMLNEKSVSPEDVISLLGPCVGLVDLVRIAVDPGKAERLVPLVAKVQALGFEIAVNFMYLSKYLGSHPWDSLQWLDELGVQQVNLVDSFGSVMPHDLDRVISRVRQNGYGFRLGFHGHDNIELAFANALTALEAKVDSLDSTVQGMGRGAGNLKTELMLTYLSREGIAIDFEALATLVESLAGLKVEHQWGASLPYMFSGINSIPQKEVMELVGKRYVSLGSIMQTLAQSGDSSTSRNYLPFRPKASPAVLLVGGGNSVTEHQQSILRFLEANREWPIVFASAKHAGLFQEVQNPHVYCLVGNEGHRLEAGRFLPVTGRDCAVIARGTGPILAYIPTHLDAACFEVETESAHQTQVTHLELALRTCQRFLELEKVYMVGFDGYSPESSDSVKRELAEENNAVIRRYSNELSLRALVPTLYHGLATESIYSLLT